MSADLRGLVNQLQTRLDKMEAALDAIADAIVWVTPDNRVQGCNAAFAQLVNRPHETVLNVDLREVLRLIYQGQIVSPTAYPTARALKGDYAVAQYTFLSDPHPLTLEITASLAASTEADRTVVLTIRDVTVLQQVDISDRQRIEMERKQREEALRLMVEGIASTTSDEFFQSCIRCLAEILQVRYALASEFVDNAKTSVRTLAIQGGGIYSENIQYDLRDTPCENVLRGEMAYYPEGVQTLFPNDLNLVEAGVESYFGLPLSNSSNQVIGHLLVMDVEPMADDPGREMVMKLFAARAGAELERRQAEERLKQQQEVLRMVIDAVPTQIFVKDWEGRYLLA
ncbi:MAG: PAS domain-containing protein, partial [Pseudanabaenales cyanobacterium]|nr:PAS domain-containing protein [Pseudanabaenales cyanobacterium]